MKTSYIELQLENQVLIRQLSRSSLNKKIRDYGLQTVISNGKFRFVEVVATTLPKKMAPFLKVTLIN